MSNKQVANIYKLGLRDYELKKFHDATALFALLTQLAPTNALYWIALGRALYEIEDYRGAEINLTAGLEIDDSEIWNFIPLIDSLVRLKELDDARDVLDQALNRIKKLQKRKDGKKLIELLQAFDKSLPKL